MKVEIENRFYSNYISNDPLRLKQVFMNLISNAIKYTKMGYISIKVFENKNLCNKNRLIDIVIEDTGLGIFLNINLFLIYFKLLILIL